VIPLGGGNSSPKNSSLSISCVVVPLKKPFLVIPVIIVEVSSSYISPYSTPKISIGSSYISFSVKYFLYL